MPTPVTQAARPKSILVVTDTPEDLTALHEQLDEAEYALAPTSGMDKALQRVKAQPPDLILLDVTSFGADGAQFCEQVRANPETEAIPIIVIAQEHGAGHEEAALQVGADGFVYRPFQRIELVSRMRTLLRMTDLLNKVAEQNRELLRANAQLDRLNQQLTARNRELELGMEMAHRLQEALLPQQYPRIKNISFSHKYSPAEAIGGDVFQISGIGGQRAAIFIADVSGHGVRAALISSIVKTVIDYIDMSDKTPSQVLADFNSRFRSVLGPMTPQIYATGVIMMVDGEKRTLAVANAGHPFPFLVSKRTMSAEPIMTLNDVGPALGFLSDPDYPTRQMQLSVGDIILAFTDGIYEIINAQGEMYGLRRLQKFVANNAHLIPRDLIPRIISETDAFLGTTKRQDDVCIVAVEVE